MSLSQFKSLSFKGNKKALSTARDFDYILNNLWSTYSEHKGIKRWNEIRSQIPEKFRKCIQIEIGHLEAGHGREQALMAVKDELEKYLKDILKADKS